MCSMYCCAHFYCFASELHLSSWRWKQCHSRNERTQKTSRKEASPFGRLVDVADLDRQQHMTSSRELDSAARLAERETVQKHSKIVRTSAREMIAMLEDTLPQQLHRLKIAILHAE